MRTFLQGKGESVVINGDISVTVLNIDGDEVILAIDAPEWVAIDEIDGSLTAELQEEWSPLQPW